MRGDSQVDRRLLRGERYRRRKRYLFEEHTRWIQKRKAGVPVQLGVPVCIIEDQFILDHKMLWEGGDIAVDS